MIGFLRGPGRTNKAKAPPPSVEARVAAAALRLQRAGELEGAEALLKLVAGETVPLAAKLGKLSRRDRDTMWPTEAEHPGESEQGMRAQHRANAPRSRRGARYERHDEGAIRAKHEIRAVLPPQEVKMAAIKSFAAREITADELRRVLRANESQPAWD
jgi:hypothetical protein